jgi:hypothetical protein
MKYGKDEIQKMFLGALLLIGLLYAYFDMLLGPLKNRHIATEKSVAALTPEISRAKAEINRSRAVEANAPIARATVAQVGEMIPEGSPVAWFPPRIADFFKARGVERVATRMNSEASEESLPGFRRLTWGVDLPAVDFVAFVNAIAELENEEPLIQITSVKLDPVAEQVDQQRALLTLTNIVKQ